MQEWAALAKNIFRMVLIDTYLVKNIAFRIYKFFLTFKKLNL